MREGRRSQTGRTLTAAEAIDGRVALARSADGRYAVVGEDERTFRVVRLSDLTTVRRLPGHGQEGWQSAAFSADGRWLYTVGWDGKIPAAATTPEAMAAASAKIHSTVNGQPLAELLGSNRPKLARSAESRILRWDLSSGESVGQLGPEDWAVLEVVGSPDGREAAYLAVFDPDYLQREVVVVRFDTATGRELARIPMPAKFWEGGTWTLSPSLDYSPRGDRLIVRSNERLIVCGLDGSVRWSVSVPRERLNYRCPTEVAMAGGGAGEEVWRPRFLPGRDIDGLVWENPQFALDRHDLVTGTRLPEFVVPLRRMREPSRGAKDHRDGVRLVIAGGTAYLSIHDLETGRWSTLAIDRRTGRASAERANLRYDLVLPAGAFLAGLAEVDADGDVLRTVDATGSGSAASSDSEIVDSGDAGRPVSASPDGRFALLESADRFTLWSLTAGKASARLDRPDDARSLDATGRPGLNASSRVAWSDDGRALLIATPLATTWNLDGLLGLIGETYWINLPGQGRFPIFNRGRLTGADPAAIQAAGATFGGSRWSFRLWDVADGTARELPLSFTGPAVDVTAVEDGWAVAGIDADHETVRLIRLGRDGGEVDASEVARPEADEASRLRVGFPSVETVKSPGYERDSTDAIALIESFYRQSTVQIRRTAGGGAEILVRDPLSYAAGLLLRTDLLGNVVRRAELESLKAPSLPPAAAVKLLIPLTMEVAAPAQSGSDVVSLGGGSDLLDRVTTSVADRASEATWEFHVHDPVAGRCVRTAPDLEGAATRDTAPAGAPSTMPVGLSVSPDGRRVCLTVAAFKATPGIARPYSHRVFDLYPRRLLRVVRSTSPLLFLPDGRHALVGERVLDLEGDPAAAPIALADFRAEPAPAAIVASNVVPADREPNAAGPWLWYLGVGVDQYADPAVPDLRFAAADARLIERRLKTVGETAGFGRIVSTVLTDADAAVRSVEQSLRDLEELSEGDDTVVISFAGHGLRRQRGLYLVTADGDPNAPQGTTVNWETVADAILKMPAGRVVVLVDACHAGAFAGSNLPIQESLRRRLGGRPGLLVVASSRGEELSRETAELRQGAFTVAVAEAVAGRRDDGGPQPDANGDGTVSAGEFSAYVASRTARLTDNRQHPVTVVATLAENEPLFHTAPATVRGDR